MWPNVFVNFLIRIRNATASLKEHTHISKKSLRKGRMNKYVKSDLNPPILC
jgi:hypothetical protein